MAERSTMELKPFKTIKQLAEGGFGKVYLVRHNQWGIVAYKTFTGSSNDETNLKVEANRHKILQHPNIVILHEAVFNSNLFGLFIEYMKYGTVDEFLGEFEVSLEWRIQIIYEVASAMSYLHGQKPVIIHGDLSCKNILIGDGFHAKIADFGLARIMKDYYSRTKTDTPLRGTTRYIAPEYFTNSTKRKSEKFDVYGFAILVWEILSKKQAFADYTLPGLLPIFVERGDRPDLEELDVATPKPIKQLIRDCWHKNEKERPIFKDITNILSPQISITQFELNRSYDSLIQQEREKPVRQANVNSERSIFPKSLIYSRISSKENIPIIDTNVTERNDDMETQRTNLSTPRFRGIELIHRLKITSEHQEVGGLAWLENKIYVTFWNSESLLVYSDTPPCKQIDKVPLKHLKTVANMVAIKSSRSIFVTCKGQESIWKIKMPEKQVSEWPVEGGETQMLSVTPDDEYLLIVHLAWNKASVREYCLDIYDPSDLRRLKRVWLPIDIMKSPETSLDIHHALILASGNIVASYQESRRVPIFRYIDPTDPNPSDNSDEEEYHNSYFFCELSPDGKIVRKKQMHSDLPTFIYLTQDDEGHLFVADCTNNTVFEMSSNVKFQLLTEEQHNIRGLGRICVGDNQRMIVAHAEKIGHFVPYVSIYKLI